MLEIYNEQPRDLLDKKKTPPGGLKVKESPERGFYGNVTSMCTSSKKTKVTFAV